MSDIEEKALALVRKEDGKGYLNYDAAIAALCRAIEQHEAFRQEVSDAVIAFMMDKPGLSGSGITHFIIPKPKPDPLVAAMEKAGWGEAYINNSEPSLRAALDALGFEIREKNDDTDN